jgi:hypothetical protein
MSELTKTIVDYAEDGNAVEVRNALYNAIQDKVMDHIEAEKQRVAQSMFNKLEEPQQATETETVIGAQEGEEV